MSKKALTSAEWAATFLAGGKHVYRRGHHYEWDGQRYVQIADNLLMKQISEFIGQRELRAATAQMVKQVAETIAQMTAVDDELSEPFSLNGQLPAENVIPFRNGLFSVDEYIKEKLSDASLHIPSNGDTFVTWSQAFNFDESQTCDRWFDFLDFFTGSDFEIITTLQQWISTVLLPEVRHEKFLWLYGDGDNGKSVFAEVISRVLGTHLVANLSIEQLAGNYELAALVNKRLNVSMEFEKFTAKLISAIKRLTSNETVAINEKYKPVYFAKLNVRLLFGSNSIPYVSDHSDGFWRRCILVPCQAKVSPEKKDLDLVNRLVTTEAAGIFNWILEGAVDVMRAGGKIFVAEQVDALVARQREIMDPHRLFVEQELTTAFVENFMPGVQGIYPRYKQWMEARGHKTPLSWERFCEVIRRVYPNAELTQQRDLVAGKCRGFRGICWRSDTEYFEEDSGPC